MPLMFLFFVLIVLWAWQLDRKRKLFSIFLVAALVQATISTGLYLVSLNPPEVLQKEVLAPGFWAAFGDARHYFMQSQALVEMTPLTDPLIPQSRFFIFILSVMGRFNSCRVIAGIGLNSLLHLMLIPLCFMFCKRLFGRKASLWISAGMASLPSGYLFASQVLRDPLIWLVAISALGLCLYLQTKRTPCNSPLCDISALSALFVCVALLSEMRPWLGYALILAVVLNFFVMSVRWLRYRELVVVGVIFCGIFVGVKNPSFHILGGEQEQEWQPSRGFEESQPEQMKGEWAHNKEKPRFGAQFLAQSEKYLRLGVLRMSSKIYQVHQEVPVIFYFCSTFDFVGLFAWAHFFRNALQKNILESSKIDGGVCFFLGFLASLQILVPLFYADSLGNFSRYIFPALMTTIIFMAAQSSVHFRKEPVLMRQST